MTERVERPGGASLLDALSTAGSDRTRHGTTGGGSSGRIGDVIEVPGAPRVNGGSGANRRPLAQLAGLPLPDGPIALCTDGIVVQANAELAELVGASDPDVLVGVSVKELLIEDGLNQRLCPADPHNDTPPRPVRVIRWRLHGQPPTENKPPSVKNGSGNPNHTDLRPSEALLFVDLMAPKGEADAVGQRRLNEARSVANMGSWEFDPQTGETAWSPSHFKILGLDVENTIPSVEAILEVLHTEDRESVLRHWQEQRESGEPTVLEYRIVRPDGEIRRILSEASATRDSAGEPVRVSGYIRDITEGWNIRTELAHERARLLEAQQIAKMGSWSFEVATGTVYLSEGLRDFARQDGIEPTGDPFAGVHPDDYPRVQAMTERLLTGQEAGTLEVELRPKGLDRVYICRAQAVRTADGVVERLQGTIQDVTEQRALERQLRNERRRLDDAQRVARMGTFEWDPATGETVWSDMLHELVGIAPNYPINYSAFMQLVHPADRQWVDDIWQQLAVDQQPVECEFRIVRPDGLGRVLRCNGAVVNSVDGPPMVVGTAQDVTEQRVAETRVERTSQRFTDLVSVTPVGIGLFDFAERLVDANGALCELLGMDIDQLRGLTADQLTHPEDRPDRLRSAAVNGGVGSYKIPQRILLRSDGEPIYCELHVANSVHDDGRRFWLVVFQDITERRRAAEALRHQATHDDLTGLPNRALVKEMLAGLLSGPDADKVAVMFCDIDNFKRVNDSLGHDAGDELLVALARRLEGGLPPGCTAARLSGDEYVIICADIDVCGGVDALATKVASLLRTVVPVHGQLVKVSASIGAAVPNGARSTGDDLLRFADAAMFEAKRRGPGRVSLASATLMANADRQVHLEGQLRDALSTDGLVLYYQPVVGPDGAVLTAEALIRWPHPDRGLLPPNAFLPVAEQGDLLRELDRWVLSKALREAVDWPLQDGKPVAVAVNLSGLVPGDPDFVDSVSNAVAESGIAWDRVVLELVETALVDLPSRTRQQMAILVERGVRFAVDDFGTGYSSLARLKELPAQIIKVDRMFVAGVGTDPSDFAVARALVDMARAMGRSCIAEGVETATQFHVLRGVGVDAYQGWLFSRAVPPKEFRAILSLGPLHVPRAS